MKKLLLTFMLVIFVQTGFAQWAAQEGIPSKYLEETITGRWTFYWVDIDTVHIDSADVDEITVDTVTVTVLLTNNGETVLGNAATDTTDVYGHINLRANGRVFNAAPSFVIFDTQTETGASIDSAALVFDGDGTPSIIFYETDGDNFSITLNTSDQALFKNASGGYVFDYVVDAPKLTADTTVTDTMDVNEINADTINVVRQVFPVTTGIQLWGDGDTYITETVDDVIDSYCGGALGMRITPNVRRIEGKSFMVGTISDTAKFQVDSSGAINLKGTGFTTDSLAYARFQGGSRTALPIRIRDVSDGIWNDGSTMALVMDALNIFYISSGGAGIFGGAVKLVYNPAAGSPGLLISSNDVNTGLIVGPTASTQDTVSLMAGGTRGVIVKQATGQGWNNDLQVEIAGDLAISNSGRILGNSTICGSDAFSGIVTADTVTLGASVGAGLTNDIFTVSLTGAPGDSVKVLFVNVLSDTTFSVNRQADGDAGQTWSWQRIMLP